MPCKSLTLALIASFLLSCSKEQVSDPMCRIAPQYQPEPAAAAACLIRVGHSLLAVKVRDQQWQLPAEKFQPDQPAQCTAHHAVWQSTGLNVEVAQPLGTTADHIQIFHCVLDADFNSDTLELPVPEWAQYHIASIELINPYETDAKQWSDNSDLIQIRTLFNQIE